MSETFVRRPVSGCIVAFVTMPGILTGLALVLAMLIGQAPPLGRLALGGLGALMLVTCLAILLGRSGVVIDAARRTITPVYGWPGIRIRGTTVVLGPGDALVIDTRVVGASARYPRMANSGIYVHGPTGTRFVMGTRSRAEAEGAAREIASLTGLGLA